MAQRPAWTRTTLRNRSFNPSRQWNRESEYCGIHHGERQLQCDCGDRQSQCGDRSHDQCARHRITQPLEHMPRQCGGACEPIRGFAAASTASLAFQLRFHIEAYGGEQAQPSSAPAAHASQGENKPNSATGMAKSAQRTCLGSTARHEVHRLDSVAAAHSG